MELKQAKAMVARINKKEGEVVASLYEDYSGRGMFGETTTGVDMPPRCVPKGTKFRTDNMGLDMIVY